MNLSIDTGMVQSYGSFHIKTDNKNEEESQKVPTSEQDEYTAVSTQGDTLQISQEGASAYQNSSQQEQNETTSQEQTNIAKIVSQSVDTGDETTSTQNLSGYSESELKEMYQNGEITKTEYDEEIASRKTEDEE